MQAAQKKESERRRSGIKLHNNSCSLLSGLFAKRLAVHYLFSPSAQHSFCSCLGTSAIVKCTESKCAKERKPRTWCAKILINLIWFMITRRGAASATTTKGREGLTTSDKANHFAITICAARRDEKEQIIVNGGALQRRCGFSRKSLKMVITALSLVSFLYVR